MKSKIDETQFDKIQQEQHMTGDFYFDANDKRIMVPRKFPLFGAAFNFGNRKTYIFIIIFLIVIFLLMLFLK